MDSRICFDGALHAQVLDLLHAFGAFGKTDAGGVSRLAASREEQGARDHLCRWLKEHGFTVLVDPIGNIFGILDLGDVEGDRVFCCGSHLDSQPDGGNFDGVLGVVCACIAARFLEDRISRGTLKPAYRYYVVACWTGEEGARFQPSLVGSSVFSGALDLDTAWALEDADGIHLKDALSGTGYLGSDDAPRPDHYLELHIEQGTRLESVGGVIGLVETCWGAHKLRVRVTGKADHTGPTPMQDRRDALLAASHVVVAVNEISEAAEETLYSSVGRMELHPNSPNTVVGDATLWVEFRSASQHALERAVQEFENRLDMIAEQTGCVLVIPLREHREAIRFDRAALGEAAAVLDSAGTPYLRLDTIAGHDAIRMQTACPSTLLFVPSKDGITHSPLEFTSNEDVCAGFDAMTAVLARLITRPDNGANTRRPER